jgi:lipopolysaccharide biosynthesis regulator YciM
MSEAKERSEDDVSEMIGEFARRVMNGEKTTDVFGVDDGFVHAVVNRAYKLYVSKSFEQAEVLLKGATALDETQAYAHLLLGDILLQRAQFVEAVEELEKARQIDGKSAEILAKLGEAKVRAGQRAEAVATLERAMDVLDGESPHRKRTEALLHVASRSGKNAPVGEQA